MAVLLTLRDIKVIIRTMEEKGVVPRERLGMDENLFNWIMTKLKKRGKNRGKYCSKMKPFTVAFSLHMIHTSTCWRFAEWWWNFSVFLSSSRFIQCHIYRIVRSVAWEISKISLQREKAHPYGNTWFLILRRWYVICSLRSHPENSNWMVICKV